MNDRATLRTFLGLVPDKAAREALSAQLHTVRELRWARELRWIPEANVHLTLRFLGATGEDVVERIVEALPQVVTRPPFTYLIGGPELFPNSRRPRLLAAQIPDSPPLLDLAASLEELAVQHGFTPERRKFRAHLTLARARGSFPGAARIEQAFEPIEARATEVTYFSSDTRPTGAVYTPIAVVPLAGDSDL